MTYKKSQKGFWKWKKYIYKMLDDVAELEIYSTQELKPKECDVIFSTAIKNGTFKGRLKTEKGLIDYKFNPKKWEND